MGGVERTAIHRLEVGERSDTFIWRNLRQGDGAGRGGGSRPFVLNANVHYSVDADIRADIFLFAEFIGGLHGADGAPTRPPSNLPLGDRGVLIAFCVTWLKCVNKVTFQIIQRVLLPWLVTELQRFLPVSGVKFRVESC